MNMNENPGKLNRRVVLTASLGGLALASLGGLAAHGDDGSTVPKYRMIGVAMPDVTAGTDRHKELASWCEKARINKVGLVAGRVDWTAFPSQDRSSWSSDFGENGDKDPLRDAINIFSGDDDPGQKIVLVVDAQAERFFEKCPKFAGIDTEGRAKTNLPSLTALVKEDSQGKFGKDIISLATELVERYNPSAISLTDLYFEDSTYGEDDLNHFRAATGVTMRTISRPMTSGSWHGVARRWPVLLPASVTQSIPRGIVAVSCGWRSAHPGTTPTGTGRTTGRTTGCWPTPQTGSFSGTTSAPSPTTCRPGTSRPLSPREPGEAECCPSACGAGNERI